MSVRIAAVGDVMLGDHPVTFGHGVGTVIEKYGFEKIFGEAKKLIKQSQVFIFNLETVLSLPSIDESALARREMRANPKVAKELAVAELSLANIANNHITQHGEQSFLETVSVLRSAGVEPLGLHESLGSNEIRLQINGAEICFLGFSMRPEKYLPGSALYAQCAGEDILNQVSTIKKENPAVIIILSLHWGEEYLSMPAPSQIRFAHELIESGVTVILGHHPHVLQPIERYGSGLIAYSLGNFIFDSWQKATRETGVLEFEIDGNGLVEYRFTPMLINRDFEVVHPGSLRDRIMMRVAQRVANPPMPAGSGNVDLDREYALIAKSAYRKYRLQCYLYFASRIWKYEPAVIFASAIRFFRRRLGHNL